MWKATVINLQRWFIIESCVRQAFESADLCQGKSAWSRSADQYSASL